MPQPKYRDMTWEQLEGSTRRALRWLNACTLLSKHDLLAVAFPPGHDRRRVDHALRIWQREAFVATVDDSNIYRLGEQGAAKLRNAGIDLRPDAANGAGIGAGGYATAAGNRPAYGNRATTGAARGTLANAAPRPTRAPPAQLLALHPLGDGRGLGSREHHLARVDSEGGATALHHDHRSAAYRGALAPMAGSVA
jgi:hypothetical protein